MNTDPRGDLLALIPPEHQKQATILLGQLLHSHTVSIVSNMTSLALKIQEHIVDRGHHLQDLSIYHDSDSGE